MIPCAHTAMNSIKILVSEREGTLHTEQQGYHNVISQLCRELAELHFEQEAEAMVASALEREAQEPTYVGRGLAVPHARVAGLPAAAIYIAACEPAIAWPQDAADTVVLLAVPAEQPELYLQLLSQVMRWRMKKQSVAQLSELLQAAR